MNKLYNLLIIYLLYNIFHKHLKMINLYIKLETKSKVNSIIFIGKVY
jgi:hypothetical protein